VPSAAHPEPVILVHGLLANETDNWQTYGPLLANNGYCVFSLTYGNMTSAPYPFNEFGGLAPMEDSALVLGAFVDRVLAATQAAKVDLVGHSEGATMPYWYLKFDGGGAKVAKMVGLSPVVHGTGTAPAVGAATVGSQLVAPNQMQDEADFLSSFCAACAELDAGSAFIQQLDAGGITVPGVSYTQIVTKYDELVRPYTSGIVDEPNSTNFTVQNQCPLDFADHLAIVSEPVAARDVLNALDPAHPKAVPCTLVLPVVG
jgi:triacylglycerol lipase